MVLIFENLCEYDDATYLAHLNALPSWRREHALKYKLLEDRKRSVLGYMLLLKAAEKRFGIKETLEFSYNEFGKPYLADNRFFFSISHSKNSVACAVSENEIGIDIQNVTPYDERVVRRMGFTTEISGEEEENILFTRLWTEREAISKFEGTGLKPPFSGGTAQNYQILTEKKPGFVLSACYGRKGEERALPKIEYINLEKI